MAFIGSAATSLRQGLRNAIAGPSSARVALPRLSTPLYSSTLPLPIFATADARSFHVSAAASISFARKKMKSHSGASKRFRPSSVKRMAVDHHAHPSRRLPLMLQAMALQKRNEASLQGASKAVQQASVDEAVQQVQIAASAGVIPADTLVPQSPQDEKALRSLESGRVPMRTLGRAWKSGRPGKRHLNSKMPNERKRRLRTAKVWGAGQINKLLHRLVGPHYGQ